ncbi:MAG: hypothetical protein AABZ60_17890 [Planctomycetota bacterium]
MNNATPRTFHFFSLYSFCLLGILILAGWHISEYYFLTDDSYITFRYLQNFLAGKGLVFNPDEYVEGYSNFLWLLLLAPPVALGYSPEIMAPIYSIFFSFLLLVFLFYATSDMLQIPKHSVFLFLGPLLLSLNRTFAAFATSGLETRMFTFFIFAAFFFFLKDAKKEEPASFWNLAGISLALASLTRPEGLAFAVALLLLRLMQRYVQFQSWWEKDISFYLWIVIPILCHFSFRGWYYEEWLPNTYYAKVSEQSRFDYGALYLKNFLFENGFYLFIPFIFLGFLQDLRRSIFFPYLTAIFLFIPYFYFVAYQGGDHFEYRPFDVCIPFLLFFTLRGLYVLFEKMHLMSRLQAYSIFSLVIFCLGLATFLPGFLLHLQTREGNYLHAQTPKLSYDMNSLPLNFLLKPFVQAYDERQEKLIQHFIGVRQEEHCKFWKKQRNQALQIYQYLKEEKIKKNPSIALHCVGIVPYFTHLPTLDILGLTDAVVARQIFPQKSSSFLMAHEKRASEDYIQRRQIIFSPLHPTTLFFEKSVAVHQYGDKKDCYYATFENHYFLFSTALKTIEKIRPYFAPEVEIGTLEQLSTPEVLHFEKPKSPDQKEYFGIRNGSFEDGDLSGWVASGTAMKFQPTYGNNIVARVIDHSPQQQGMFWIGTYEATTSGNQITPYQMQGEEPVGNLLSEPFTLSKNTLYFRMSGGVSEQIYVALLIQETPVYRIFNTYPTDEMREVFLNVKEFQGQVAQILIMDGSSEFWGHINADDFRLLDR